MDAETKRPQVGGSLNPDTCGQQARGVRNWQNITDVFYGWPLKGWNYVEISPDMPINMYYCTNSS